MRVTVHPGRLEGTLRAVSSKSYAHRMLIAAAQADRPTEVAYEPCGADVEVTLGCLEALGSAVERKDGGVRVAPMKPDRLPDAPLLDCGESGSTLRFLLPLACCMEKPVRLTGHGRLPARPLSALLEQLRAHGADVEGDSLPLRVSGPLESGTYTLPGDVSSQYLTGLLLALPRLPRESQLILTSSLQSKGYVDMTLEILAQFGVQVEQGPDGYRIPGGQRFVSPGSLRVEGDWSGAAFWITANLLGGNVRVEGLNAASLQGDARVVAAARQRARGGTGTLDWSDIPDLLPALAVGATRTPGVTRLTRLARLRLKESDRLAAMAEGLARMGARIVQEDDIWTIEGGQRLTGGQVDAYGDHRIAMALAIAATAAEGPVTIQGAESVEKSYLNFWEDLKRVGGRIDVEPDR